MHRLFLALALAGGVAGALDAGSAPAAAGPSTAVADTGPALSIHVVTERVDARGRRRLAGQSLARTGTRIALTPDGSRKEWIFERNPLDPARVSGYLIDHAARRIVVYQESDLRNREGLAAWGDVWHMRVDPRDLKQMTRTAERPQVNGVPFVRYRREGSGSGTVLVDWSDEHGLPGRVEVRDAEGVTVSQVDRLVPLADAGVPGDPTSRHADYEIVDVADLGEHHH